MKIKDKKTLMKICIGAVVFILIILCIWLIPRENDEKKDNLPNLTVTEDEIKQDMVTDTDEPIIELEDDVFDDSDSVDTDDTNTETQDDNTSENNNSNDNSNSGNNGNIGNSGDNNLEEDESPTDAVVLPEVPIP